MANGDGVAAVPFAEVEVEAGLLGFVGAAVDSIRAVRVRLRCRGAFGMIDNMWLDTRTSFRLNLDKIDKSNRERKKKV